MRMKKGISLVVLVVTIIIMIILTSTIILSLTGTNIIEKAIDAVEQSNLKQVKTIAQNTWSEGNLVGKDIETIKKDIIEKIGEKEANKHSIHVTEDEIEVMLLPRDWRNSVTEIVDGVPIPDGFVVSPYRGENTVEQGLVIYALTEEEIDQGVYDITKKDEDKQDSLENRNQFVWVPVDRNNFPHYLIPIY